MEKEQIKSLELAPPSSFIPPSLPLAITAEIATSLSLLLLSQWQVEYLPVLAGRGWRQSQRLQKRLDLLTIFSPCDDLSRRRNQETIQYGMGNSKKSSNVDVVFLLLLFHVHDTSPLPSPHEDTRRHHG
jgi:hypothetical protein